MSSFFGATQPAGPSPLNMAKMEAEVLTEMFGKMSSSCFRKCVVKFGDGDLTVGEMSCVDRCVGKYLMAQERVGNTLKQFEDQMKAQQTAQPGQARFPA